MRTFEWKEIQKVDSDKIRIAKIEAHRAIQNVALIGRKFLNIDQNSDLNSTLYWVPGFTRLAGRWIKGKKIFRSSINLETFEIFIVDEKINTLATYPLVGCTQRQLMIWLEEQIGKLGLAVPDLAMNLPYDLPEVHSLQQEKFEMTDLLANAELAKYFHNSYSLLRDIKAHFESDNVILVWPEKFNQQLDIVLKESGDPDTDTIISFGMSPGDETFESPYFYVRTKPHVDISVLAKLESHAFWMSEEWTGAILPSKHIFQDDQKSIVESFYQKTGEILIKLLID